MLMFSTLRNLLRLRVRPLFRRIPAPLFRRIPAPLVVSPTAPRAVADPPKDAVCIEPDCDRSPVFARPSQFTWLNDDGAWMPGSVDELVCSVHAYDTPKNEGTP